MTDKSRSSKDIKVGNIERSTGIAIGNHAKATVTTTQGTSADDISKIFENLLEKINALSESENKSDASDAIKRLEDEAHKGDQANEERVNRWFNFLAEAAPDVWEVAANTFVNPISGLSTVFKKVAERAKSERENSKS